MKKFNYIWRTLNIFMLLIRLCWNFSLDSVHCPDGTHRHLRAKSVCNQTFPSYMCLFDEVLENTVERCEKESNFQTPGFKFVLRGGFDGQPCHISLFQPFKFWRNESSECVFLKYYCEEEGQKMVSVGSTTVGVSCRCDYRRGYAFVRTPLNILNCQPFKEDCSCYYKDCGKNTTLSSDYQCVSKNNTQCQEYPKLSNRVQVQIQAQIKENETVSEDPDLSGSSSTLIYVTVLISAVIVLLIVLFGYMLYEAVSCDDSSLAIHFYGSGLRNSKEVDLENKTENFDPRIFLTEGELKCVKRYRSNALFPILCKLYKSRFGREYSSKLLEFFSEPEQIVIEYLNYCNLDQTISVTFVTLILFVLYGNCISDDMFLYKSHMNYVVSVISKRLNMKKTLTCKDIKTELEGSLGIYVSKRNGFYELSTDNLFIVLLSFCEKRLLDLAINLGHPNVIQKQFVFESKAEKFTDVEMKITISEGHEKRYIDRLICDIKNGYISIVFTNPHMQSKEIRGNFLDKLRNDQEAMDKLRALSKQLLSPLLLVSREGYFDLAEEFIKQNFDVNARDEFGSTPLYISSERGHLTLAELLLQNFADCNLCTFRNESPLFVAVLNGHIDIVNLLLQHRCFYNGKNNNDICSDKVNCKCQHSINLHGGTYHNKSINDLKVDSVDALATTPIHVAVQEEFKDIVELLLEKKANPNVYDANHVTPLYLASNCGNLEILKMLLSKEADPKFYSSVEKSPLWVAIDGGYVDIVRTLIQNGACKYLNSYDSKALQDFAKENANAEINQIVTTGMKHCC